MSPGIEGSSTRPLTIIQPQTTSADPAGTQDVQGAQRAGADEKTASTAATQTSAQPLKDKFETVQSTPLQSIFSEGRTESPQEPLGPPMMIRDLSGGTGGPTQALMQVDPQGSSEPLPTWAGVGAAEQQQDGSLPLPTYGDIDKIEGPVSSEALPTASQNSFPTGIQQATTPTSEALPTMSIIALPTGIQLETER